jgi:hypothetical protein
MAHGEFWMDRFGKKSHIPFEELSPGQSCPDLFAFAFRSVPRRNQPAVENALDSRARERNQSCYDNAQRERDK